MKEQEIIASLKKVGIKVNSIYDLVNSRLSYPLAIPILLEALRSGIEDGSTKEGVIRALAVKEAYGVADDDLINEFYKEKGNTYLQWAIGNSLEVVLSAKNVNEALTIIKDKSNGIARQMLILALARFNSIEVETCLIELLSDDDVVLHTLGALKKIKSLKAKPYIEKLLTHSRIAVRKEAAKTLQKLGRHSGR